MCKTKVHLNVNSLSIQESNEVSKLIPVMEVDHYKIPIQIAPFLPFCVEILKNCFKIDLILYVLPAFISLKHIHVWCLQRSEEG